MDDLKTRQNLAAAAAAGIRTTISPTSSPQSGHYTELYRFTLCFYTNVLSRSCFSAILHWKLQCYSSQSPSTETNATSRVEMKSISGQTDQCFQIRKCLLHALGGGRNKLPKKSGNRTSGKVEGG